jgi:hypothetical protein
MGLDAYLNQTCTITREVPDGTDQYNNATYDTDTVASDVRCRKVQKTLRMMDERTGEYAFVRADLILLPAGLEVKPKDVISITGSVAWSVKTPFVRQRFNDQHHVSCLVEAINA